MHDVVVIVLLMMLLVVLLMLKLLQEILLRLPSGVDASLIFFSILISDF